MKWIKYSLGCFVAGMLCTTAALADDFTDRVVAAKKAIATPDGAQYDQLLVPYIAPAINGCIPTVAATGTYVGRFTLVADVLDDGHLSRTQVEPKTAMSECFAQQFGQPHLPALKLNGVQHAPHPIVVNVFIAPRP